MTSTRFFREETVPRYILILIFLFFSLNFLFSQDDDKIFVPLLVGDEYLGEVLMRVEETENLFSHDQLLSFLEPFLNADIRSILADMGEGREWVSIFNLQGCGLEAEFREEYLDLLIEIPPLARKEQNIDLQGTVRNYSGVAIKPADFSGWVNSALLLKQVYENSNFTIEEELNAGLNFRSWVLDSSVTFSNTDEIFELEHLRLIKDIPFLTSRAEAGDLSFSMDGADNVSYITGLSLVRTFGIKPEIPRTPLGRESIFLEQDSLVEIEVNGRIVREMDLVAGLYNIENFGLSEGVNQVNIFVTDEEGRQESSLLFPLAANLLREREFDFGIAVGLPERQLDLPVLAAYQRAGITDNLTFTLKEIVPFHTGQMYLEFNGVGATAAGNFQLKTAFSTVPGENADLFLTGKYSYSNIQKPQIGAFGGVVYYDLAIQSLEPGETGNSNLTASLYYTLPLPRGFTATPSVIYSSQAETGRKIRVTTLLRKRLGGGSALSFDMNYIWDESGGNSFTGTISFSTIFPEHNQSLMIRQDLDDQIFYFNWNRFPSNSTGLDMNTSIQMPFDTLERSTYNLGAGYSMPYGTADFSHRLATIIDKPEETINTSQLTVSNGFVFAGDSIGFSRTVRDSFVIVRADEIIQDSNIRVNPSGRGQKGIAGRMNVVLPGITSYKPSLVRLEAEVLPIGVELNETQFVYTPTFRSGGLIKVSVMQNVYSGGQLLDDEGDPVPYGFGTILKVAASPEGEEGASPGAESDDTLYDMEALEFFTDEDGYFEVYNLSPGEWEMTILNMKSGVFRLVIPDDAFGYYDAGVVKEAVK